MYFQRDYVLRMIEMMGDLVRRIGMIAREADARAELDEVAQRACGLPMTMLQTGEPEDLENLLNEPQRYLASELLLIAVEIERRTQTDDALAPLQAQAIALLCHLTDADYMLPAADRVAGILKDALGTLPPQALLDAAILLERAGRYAAAEDALFAAMEHTPAAQPPAVAFYDRLALLSESALRAGGLSPEEVAEGRAQATQ